MVRLSVTGTAPKGVDIVYGTDTSNYQGGRLLFSKTLSLDNSALYYHINAQLQGGGNITCTLSIETTQVTGHAQGGYNICSAQLNNTGDGSWAR